MTTIAYKSGKLATDSKASSGDSVWDGQSKKIFRVRGDVISVAGDIDSEQLFLKWYKEGCPDKKPHLTQDFVALVFTKEKKIYTYFAKCMPHDRSHLKIIAEGSGAQFAIGAMEAGASPERAVKIAMQYDNGSGGRVQKAVVWKP